MSARVMDGSWCSSPAALAGQHVSRTVSLSGDSQLAKVIRGVGLTVGRASQPSVWVHRWRGLACGRSQADSQARLKWSTVRWQARMLATAWTVPK